MTHVGCAIYTRKSSEEGLDQAFNSLDAQREACAAYVLSQRHAGWRELPDMYDDGGLSGGSMERPALCRLLADVEAGKVRIVVVYKVDRLTRSLADFAKIVEIFDAHGASFVSVTQQFNTTTSMGRLTLNMLLSFAQFEREIAGERIRDKIAASKAKGMWMGGTVPLGFRVADRKLIVEPTEAEMVRMIFRRYAELGSVALLRKELIARGIARTRSRAADGGGQAFERGALYTLLRNRTYRGQISHKQAIHNGVHDAIVEPDLWQAVQDRLDANKRSHDLGLDAKQPSLLVGLLRDAGGRRMTPTHAVKRGRRYRYYATDELIRNGPKTGRGGLRLPAGEIEGVVQDRVRSFLASPNNVATALAGLSLRAGTLDSILRWACDRAARWTVMPPAEIAEVVRTLVILVRINPETVEIQLSADKLCALSGAGERSNVGSPAIVAPVSLTVTVTLQQVGKGKRLVIGHGGPLEINDGLVRLLREAHEARELVLADTDESLNAMTARRGKSKGHLTALMRLAYLDPTIVRDCLRGRQPVELTPTRLLRLSQNLPILWSEQRAHLGFAASN